MAISVGDTLPDAIFMHMGATGPERITTQALFASKTVALFALPGAFTPTCSHQHLPAYIQHAEALHKKGVDTIICLSVNDAFVMDAWGKQQGVEGKVMMLADGNADFTLAIGLNMDGGGMGMGMRSLRYSMLVRDGVVDMLNVESNPAEAQESGAENMLSQL